MGMLLMFEMLSPEDIAMVNAGMKSLKMSGIFLLRSRLNPDVGLVLSVLFFDGVWLIMVEVADMEEFGSEVCPGLENWDTFPSLWYGLLLGLFCRCWSGVDFCA